LGRLIAQTFNCSQTSPEQGSSWSENDHHNEGIKLEKQQPLIRPQVLPSWWPMVMSQLKFNVASAHLLRWQRLELFSWDLVS